MDNKNELVISYLQLRRIVGIVGMSLPVITAVGAWLIFSVGLQESLSVYYYTPMRDVWVGLIFFLGGFFWSYRGYNLADRIAGKLATLFGWLFVIFPPGKSTTPMDISGYLHAIFAAAFFVTLICVSAFLFTKTDPNKPPTPQKLRRNTIYRVCAIVMAISLGVGAVLYYLPAFAPFRPMFWGETFAIEAFGFSWFVKGEGILKDEERAR
jgi:hypothetical protein